MKPELVSLGGMYVDIHILKFPFKNAISPEKEVVGKDYKITVGGSALNFAVFSANLGLETVVKDSKNGAVGFFGLKIMEVPAFEVKEILNPVGAGDSFNADFINAQNDGTNLFESIRFANTVAAVKISRFSAPTIEKAKLLLTF